MYLPEDAFPALYLDLLLACGETPYPTKILLTPDLNTPYLGVMPSKQEKGI